MQIHNECSTTRDLADSFGDGYLVRKNRIYKAIRTNALELGYTYSSETDPAYLALPFAQLERILESKRIPYFNNVDVLKTLLKTLREDVVWDDVSDGLKKNFLFHESCHAVARAIQKTATAESDAAKTFRILLEESFANTCELLGLAEAEDPAHRLFYGLNSYTILFEERSNLKNSILQFGFETVFKTALLSYLHSNLLFDRLDDNQWRRCLEVAEANTSEGRQIRMLKRVSNLAFTLDLRFREITTQFHLRLNNIAMPPEKMRAFNPLSDDRLPEFLNSAAHILTG